MKKLTFNHSHIVDAYLEHDQNGDLVVVVKTKAVLYRDLTGFDVDLRDSVESEWLRLFHEHRCAGGKLLMVGGGADSSQ